MEILTMPFPTEGREAHWRFSGQETAGLAAHVCLFVLGKQKTLAEPCAGLPVRQSGRRR
jgi:hypothetical protein